ncbi:signal recognition particle 14kD protein [Aureobasidium pullulans]|uniref:Signal recognition particle subunit SRP14 n=1 Tax=Aureobasidium pullulans TaxID=5580 RepID=A0A4S8XBV5_AURPU|nr:signal recognition particle 14kD protein [Aureobasidium pullulans]TIA64136.1 signal recognition particle 14kD protein [Aureobasidium pullulans]
MSSHSSNDEFFTKLASLLETRQQKGHGSIFLTQKRLTHDESTSSKPADFPLADLEPPSAPLPILIRATDGNSQTKDRKKSEKIKLSTVVQPDDLESFYTRYAEICKQGMQALKKRDRSKRKKQKQGKKKAQDDKK